MILKLISLNLLQYRKVSTDNLPEDASSVPVIMHERREDIHKFMMEEAERRRAKGETAFDVDPEIKNERDRDFVTMMKSR